MYLLFAGEGYYPSGGAQDLIGKFDTIQQCEDKMLEIKDNYYGTWGNILSLETLKIVASFEEGIWEYE